MKSSVVPLLRMQLLGALGLNRILHAGNAEERRKALPMAIVVVGVGCLALALSWLVSAGFAALGRPDALPAIVALLCTAAVLGLTFLKSQGMLAGGQDYDLVMSLPVTPAQAVVSRLASAYLVNVLLCAIAVAPAAIVLAEEGCSSALGITLFAVAVPVIPLLPMAVALAGGTAIAAAASRARRSNALSLLLSTVLVLVLVACSFSLNTIGSDDAENAMNALAGVASCYPPATAIAAAAAADPVPLAVLAIVSIAVAGTFVAVAARLYRTLNNLAPRSSATHWDTRALRVKSPFAALYRREFQRYFSCTIYALNSSIGIVLLLLLSVFFLVADPYTFADPSNEVDLTGLLRSALPFFAALFVSMTCTTSASLSLEGKSLWIACSVPVRTLDLLKAKMALNLTVIAPFALVSTVLLAIATQVTGAELALLFLVPTAYACFITVFGMAMNIRFPRYDWTSEYYAVKGGAISVLAATIAGMICSIVPFVLCLVFHSFAQTISLVVAVVILLITALIYHRLSSYRLYGA